MLNKILTIFFLILTVPLHSQNIIDLLKDKEPAKGFEPFLRIGIKVDVDTFSIEGDAEIFDKNGKNLGSIQGKYTITASGGSIAVSGKKFGSGMIKFTPKFMLIKVGKRMFRGEIEIWLKNGKLTVINDLNIEDYVRGVINKEAIPSWPLEAKKTQAVLARTFAVYQKMFNPRNDLFDLAPSVLDQVYDGLDKEDVTSNKAVDETRGEVITKGHHPVKIYFHSTCGGMTSSSSEIWKKDEPHLKSVKCPYCKKSSLYRWKRSVSSKTLSDKLNVRKVKSIKTIRSETRVESVMVDGKKIPVNKFRELVGFSVIWSNDFTVSKSGSNFIFEGKGAGHGVGVCQWGMAGMAAAGKNYKEILNFYLTGVDIRKMY